MMHAPIDGVAKRVPAPVDRRERRSVSMPGFAVLENGTTEEIQLLDLSYDGCGIAIEAKLAPGQRIKLSVLRRGAIDAEVRWWADGKAGLVFPVEAVTPEPKPRQSERTALSAEVTMRRLGKGSFRVNVFDASPQGCKVDLVERPAAGEFVTVRFDGLEPMEAEVCWVERFTAGLRFRKPMHPAVFELLIERLSG